MRNKTPKVKNINPKNEAVSNDSFSKSREMIITNTGAIPRITI